MPKTVIKRTQTGVRIESSLLKVLKGVAEYTDLTLGDLLEGIVLHAFEGKAPFSPETREVIEQLKAVYGCELTASDSHQLVESESLMRLPTKRPARCDSRHLILQTMPEEKDERRVFGAGMLLVRQ